MLRLWTATLNDEARPFNALFSCGGNLGNGLVLMAGPRAARSSGRWVGAQGMAAQSPESTVDFA